MHRHLLKQTQNINASRPLNRWLFSGSRANVDYGSKYAEKLRQRASEKGMTLDALKAKVKEEQIEEARRKRGLKAAQAEHAAQIAAKASASKSSPQAQSQVETSLSSVRKDSSPVKPLTSILNLQKLMATPHTPDQIGALWTAYHLSKSGGTGRGYVCAAVTLELYKKMAGVAEQYPTFIVPVRRKKPVTSPKIQGEEDAAYEFYFLQWDFHDVPPVPSATEDLFAPSKPASAGPNPKISTILFTPLQEYKMRAAFATPYLVLTHYTDLAHSHGVVLLRGEITPNSNSANARGEGNYMLTQEDAQLLSMVAQKFYLWDNQGQVSAGGELLKCFHEKPQEFEWEELLKHANLTC
ncbi:hypothetical protein E4T56_gene979 [Termitomyces sp. T112]|nr:hypothetical protein E4T56_gene979 [Termitomyces sp. T112]KAH0590257.1 hypothetical protein H2248_000427 [Termitomyces sp. 'cryptogamus']KNZ78128.1 Protein atp11, mitochondrial [Termitomyces sp. J132]